MKDGMSGMLQQVRLGQVRKARKSSIIQPPPPPPFHVHFSKFKKKSSDKGSPWRCQVMKERAEGPIQTS
jgi:hypothetical protein